MKNTSKPLIWFVASFIVFHLILFIMWGEHQEYWYLYTGIMLISALVMYFINGYHIKTSINLYWCGSNHRCCISDNTTYIFTYIVTNYLYRIN